MKEVCIIDGVCGMGKTTSIKAEIKKITEGIANPTKEDPKVIFSSPYREDCMIMAEVDYTTTDKVANPIFNKSREVIYKAKSFPFKFYSNMFYKKDDYRTLQEKITELIKSNRNIVITHESLLRLPLTVIDLLQEYNYHLIIDESPATMQVVEDIGETPIDKEELEMLIERDIVLKHNITAQLTWNEEGKTKLKRYSEVQAIMNKGEFYLYKDTSLKGNHCVFILLAHSNLFLKPISVSIYTYLFEGTYCSAYFKLKKIPYKLIDRTKNEVIYNSAIYNYDLLINLYIPRDLNHEIFTHETTFSKKWYLETSKNLSLKKKGDVYSGKKVLTKTGKESISLLVKKTNSFMRMPFIKPSRELKAENDFLIEEIVKTGIGSTTLLQKLKEELEEEKCTSDEKLYSTFKDFRQIVLPNTSAGYSESNFLVFNQKATNSYMHIKRVAYLVNVYPHGDIVTFLSSKGITIDKKEYATSELIQWIFRSRIRSGKKIDVFIPSYRMRMLLIEWMNTIKQQRHDRLDEIASFPTFS